MKITFWHHLGTRKLKRCAASNPGEQPRNLLRQLGDIWGFPKMEVNMDGLRMDNSSINGWLGGTLISGNHHKYVCVYIYIHYIYIYLCVCVASLTQIQDWSIGYRKTFLLVDGQGGAHISATNPSEIIDKNQHSCWLYQHFLQCGPTS